MNLPVIAVWRHLAIVGPLRRLNPSPQTILDMGGTGRLGSFVDSRITNANIRQGIDGCELPYENDSFDAAVSASTLEHVSDPVKFLEESARVSRGVALHFAPFGEAAAEVERFKKGLPGYKHPCVVPQPDIIPGEWFVYPHMTISEHLLLLATIRPQLRIDALYDYAYDHKEEFYGAVVSNLELPL